MIVGKTSDPAIGKQPPVLSAQPLIFPAAESIPFRFPQHLTLSNPFPTLSHSLQILSRFPPVPSPLCVGSGCSLPRSVVSCVDLNIWRSPLFSCTGCHRWSIYCTWWWAEQACQRIMLMPHPLCAESFHLATGPLLSRNRGCNLKLYNWKSQIPKWQHSR